MNSELIVNLWAIYDAASGFVYGVSGRVYCATGTDQEKLILLKQLSGSDYMTAKRNHLPKRFSVGEIGGESQRGLAPLSAVHDPSAQLFEELFKTLEQELPPTPNFLAQDVEITPKKIPADPLCTVTILYEDEVGKIRPVISAEDQEWFVDQERQRGRHFTHT